MAKEQSEIIVFVDVQPLCTLGSGKCDQCSSPTIAAPLEYPIITGDYYMRISNIPGEQCTQHNCRAAFLTPTPITEALEQVLTYPVVMENDALKHAICDEYTRMQVLDEILVPQVSLPLD